MTAKQTSIPALALSALILFLTSLSLSAQEFEQALDVTGAANTPDDVVAFGMHPDATDGLDDGEDVVPPPPPGNSNTIAFVPENIESKLIRDIRAPAEEKTWKISAVKEDPDQNIVMTWDAAEWTGVDPLPELNLTGAILDQDYDLTQPAPAGGIAIAETATLYITYGTPDPLPQAGSLEVAAEDEGGNAYYDGEWKLDNTDGSDVIGTDGETNLSVWIGLGTTALENIPVGTYKVTFRSTHPSYEAPDDIDDVEINDGVQTDYPDADAGSAAPVFSRVPASLELNPARVTVSESGSTTDVNLTLGSKPLADVDIVFSIGGEHPDAAQITAGGSVTFTPDNYDAPQIVTIQGQDDNIAQDQDRSFRLDFAVTSDDSLYNEFENDFPDEDKVRGVTIDDDRPELVVDRVDGAVETTEAGGTAQFNIVLGSEPTENVTVTIASTDSSEGIPDSDTVVFTSADWNAPQLVTVTGQDDAEADGDMQYRVVCRAESDYADYDGRSRALRYVNVDDDEAERTADLVFIPGKTLPFGMIPEGGSRTRTLTVYNGGVAEAQLSAEVFVPARSEGFAVEGATDHDFTLPAGEGVQLEVTATAKDAADGEQTRAALLFTDQGGDDTPVAAIALSSLTVPLPEAGTLAVEPELIVVDFSGETESGAFDIALDTNIRFARLLLSLELPSFLNVTGVETNTDATSGWNFGYRVNEDDGILSAFYLDPLYNDDPPNSGIDTGENVILTVSFEVDTAAVEEDVSEPIVFHEAAAADESNQYELAWTGDDNTATRAAGDDLAATDGLVAVSNKITLADLDVDENGTLDVFDVIYVYRKIVLSKTAANLVPVGFTPQITSEQIAANISDLQSLLDVDGNAAVDVFDVIYIYRQVVLSKSAENLIPEGFSPSATATEIATSIEEIKP